VSAQQTQLIERVEAFVKSSFPNQFLIPVAGFSILAGKTYGAVRNEMSRDEFPLTIVRQGSRNFVATPDVVDYLAALWAGSDSCVAKSGTAETTEPAPRRAGAPVKNPAAKARAAVAREARRAKRAAAAVAVEGGAQ